jgi:hypothetical protein
LHDIEGTLRGEGVVVMMDMRYDLPFLCVRVGGNGEVWLFGGSVDGFGGWCMGERNSGWIDKGDGGSSEFWADGVFCGGGDVVEGGIGLDGRRHVVMGWKCCWRYDLRERMETLRFFRPLLSCLEGNNGFFRW